MQEPNVRQNRYLCVAMQAVFSMLIRSCFTNDGEKIAFTSRKAKGFIWHSLPGKQCPCASGWAASQLGLNCLQGRRHNITVNIRKHCNLLFAYNFIWQKQGSWGKRNNRQCAWLLATPLACLAENALLDSEQTITGLIRTGTTKTSGWDSCSSGQDREEPSMAECRGNSTKS